MAIKTINDTHLTSIADAIRSKNGETSRYTPADMPAAIGRISGGGGIEKKTLIYTNQNVESLLTNDWLYYFGKYIDSIELNCNLTQDINGYSYVNFCRDNNKVTSIPNIKFVIDGSLYPSKSSSEIKFDSGFSRNERISSFDNVTIETKGLNNSNGYWGGSYSNLFKSDYSLINSPNFLTQINHKYPYKPISSVYMYLFQNCSSLKQAKLPVGEYLTSNKFESTFSNCVRLSHITFMLENNSPIILTWHWYHQTINLSKVGYGKDALTKNIPTEELYPVNKQITDSVSYENLKNDLKAWTLDSNYSFYNHDSAVETINSLPDTNYSASKGVNTITFLGSAGSATDGGAINTLTEEEIAVATAKGWTVTLI